MDYTYTGLKKPDKGDPVRISDINENFDKVTVSNKNLLLNWDFRNPVNQRGKNDYLAYVYSLDRWMLTIGRVEIIPNGIRLKSESMIDQPIGIKEMELLAGKTLTLSLKKTDGTIVSGSISLPEPIRSQGYYPYTNDEVSIQLYTSSIERDCIAFRIYALKDIDIAAIKLELGPVSTLANDPPANYGEQLALCQRYCQRYEGYVGYSLPASDSVVYPSVRLRTQMRVPPSLASYSDASITDDYVWFPVSEISMNMYTTKDTAVIQCISSGLNPTKGYDVKCGSIIFDAEIY